MVLGLEIFPPFDFRPLAGSCIPRRLSLTAIPPRCDFPPVAATALPLRAPILRAMKLASGAVIHPDKVFHATKSCHLPYFSYSNRCSSACSATVTVLMLDGSLDPPICRGIMWCLCFKEFRIHQRHSSILEYPWYCRNHLHTWPPPTNPHPQASSTPMLCR